ncbi:hypothetical protein C5B42_01450 [Candidatus Cerribacteria bacterium 'Amazon FNV 2010 28 9']|uniref:Uncharacterized protein n=1 Tax=Candidatus Cerribacteria bacterium 'Amazon FNV 2010 28 9' TaxID=2081795 RepID=A0A317JUL8_9BACT|nr:MAG: hypothetical protein C5B42_01450 [Candidatus Cerribacteria bacterium 'Amazon FNV 2010 28 9']
MNAITFAKAIKIFTSLFFLYKAVTSLIVIFNASRIMLVATENYFSIGIVYVIIIPFVVLFLPNLITSILIWKEKQIGYILGLTISLLAVFVFILGVESIVSHGIDTTFLSLVGTNLIDIIGIILCLFGFFPKLNKNRPSLNQ